MIAIYLYSNAFLYLIFSVWCLLKMEGTARFSGFSFLNNSGKVEYLTVYTGLQAGFAVFLGLTAYVEQMNVPGLFFCVSMYIGIVLTRTLSALYYKKLSNSTYFIGALEYVLGIWGVILLLTYLDNN